MATTENLIYFDYEALAADLASWDTGNGPIKVQLSATGYPEDPRAVSPQVIQFVEAELIDRKIKVEIGEPGCQVFTEGGASAKAGAELARVLLRHQPLPIEGQIYHLVSQVKGLTDPMEKPFRAFRITSKNGTVLREFEALSEASEAIQTWQGLEDTLVVGVTTKELVRGLLVRGIRLGVMDDPLPILCQVGVGIAGKDKAYFLMQALDKRWSSLEAVQDEGQRVAKDLHRRLKNALENRS